jgi:hypothetical protein
MSFDVDHRRRCDNSCEFMPKNACIAHGIADGLPPVSALSARATALSCPFPNETIPPYVSGSNGSEQRHQQYPFDHRAKGCHPWRDETANTSILQTTNDRLYVFTPTENDVQRWPRTASSNVGKNSANNSNALTTITNRTGKIPHGLPASVCQVKSIFNNNQMHEQANARSSQEEEEEDRRACFTHRQQLPVLSSMPPFDPPYRQEPNLERRSMPLHQTFFAMTDKNARRTANRIKNDQSDRMIRVSENEKYFIVENATAISCTKNCISHCTPAIIIVCGQLYGPKQTVFPQTRERILTPNDLKEPVTFESYLLYREPETGNQVKQPIEQYSPLTMSVITRCWMLCVLKGSIDCSVWPPQPKDVKFEPLLDSCISITSS